MGAGNSRSEEIAAFQEKRPPFASKVRDVDYAIKIEWADAQIHGAQKMSGVYVGIDRLPDLVNWLICKIKEDHAYKRLIVTIDIGKEFRDTGMMRSWMTSIAPEIQALTLNGSSVMSLRITGEFDTNLTRADRVSWWRDFVKLSNYLGLEYELNTLFHIEPVGIDQLGGEHGLLAALKFKPT
jgi:hypothetical protein